MNNGIRIISFGCSGIGLALAAIPFFPSTIKAVQVAIHKNNSLIEQQIAKENLSAQEELRRYGYKERQKTLDVQSKIGEHIEYSQVTVENYTFSHSYPPKLDMSAFKPNERIQVYDRNGVCIGRIRNQRFEFKVHYLNTCLTKQPTNKEKN